MQKRSTFYILHSAVAKGEDPSSLIPHPSSLIPHPSSLIPHPSSLIPHPSSLIPHPSSLTLPLAPLLHLFLGEPVQRRRLDAEDREVEVDLPPVVDLVLDHRAQPLADAQLGAARRDALRVEVGIAQGAEDGHRLLVHA